MDYFKSLITDRWGMYSGISYSDLKARVSSQPYAVVKTSGAVQVYQRGANKMWLDLIFPGDVEILYRGQNLYQDTALRILHASYSGSPIKELRNKFLREIAEEAEAKKEFDLSMWRKVTEPTQVFLNLAENPSWRALPDAKFADHLRLHFLSRDFLFFSKSREGAQEFAEIKPRRKTSSYRFHKEAFLRSIKPNYRSSIHVGYEEASAKVKHWEIGFPVAEQEDIVRKLILALEPLED